MSEAAIESTEVDGKCDARFEAVRESFAENFERRGEIGGAVAVYLDGQPVVDLWGGRVIHGGESVEPWVQDTAPRRSSIAASNVSRRSKRTPSISPPRPSAAKSRPTARAWPLPDGISVVR